MNKVLKTLPLLATFCLASCGETKFNILKDYLIEMPTYKEIDYSFAEEHFKNTPVGGHGCTAVVKDLGGGNLIVGRNMDYSYSKKSAFIVRTEVPGEYKTLGFSYGVNKTAQDFEDIRDHGLTDEWKKLIPFYCGDIINEKGFYCEIDMRNPEKNKDGSDKFGCDGTNKSAPTLVNMVQVTRFLTAHCANVPEAVEYAKNNINIYNCAGDWNFAYCLADAEGNYGILEIAHNKVYFNDKQTRHSNYYVTPELNAEAELKFGIGRTDYIDKHLAEVTDKESMYDLMNNLSYSNVYKLDECPFDMRSEACTFDGNPLTFDELMDDANKEAVYAALHELKETTLDKMSEEEKKALPWYWQSSFTNVIDPKAKTMHIRFFENSEYIFDYSI